MRQLLLPFQLKNESVFENFYAGKNKKMLEYLKNPPERLIYLYGAPQNGLTHLLQALCHEKKHGLYLSFKNHLDVSPLILKNLSSLNIIVLDDLEVIAGHAEWEEALFHAFNEIQQAGYSCYAEDPKKNHNNIYFIVGSHLFPSELKFKLPDLMSRLQSMLLLILLELSDEEKLGALQQRAKLRGFELPKITGEYLLHHIPRNMGYLFECLYKLEKFSLQEKHKLTIPFLKKFISSFY